MKKYLLCILVFTVNLGITACSTHTHFKEGELPEYCFNGVIYLGTGNGYTAKFEPSGERAVTMYDGRQCLPDN